jgi:hypothetical protein
MFIEPPFLIKFKSSNKIRNCYCVYREYRIYEIPPPQGLSEARRGGKVFINFITVLIKFIIRMDKKFSPETGER